MHARPSSSPLGAGGVWCVFAIALGVSAGPACARVLEMRIDSREDLLLDKTYPGAGP
jgi:hypothetical protein